MGKLIWYLSPLLEFTRRTILFNEEGPKQHRRCIGCQAAQQQQPGSSIQQQLAPQLLEEH